MKMSQLIVWLTRIPQARSWRLHRRTVWKLGYLIFKIPFIGDYLTKIDESGLKILGSASTLHIWCENFDFSCNWQLSTVKTVEKLS